MATLTTLKKKIAALEAQVERATKAEMGNAIAKIRKIMGDYGVTIEHLVDGAKHGRATASKKASGAKTAKASKAKKPAKYMDPKSGATWSGLGRIPAWIAKAKNRDAFLIGKPTAAEAPKTSAAKSPGKRAGAKVAAKAARAASKVTRKKSATAKKAAPAKKAAASGPVPAKRASAKKAAGKAARKSPASKKAPAPASASATTADASTTAS